MSVVKSGYMRKHSKSMLSGGWNQVWVILYKDTNLVVFKKQGDSTPMGTINMFEVKKWFAYGQHTNHMPERPNPPAGASVNQILAVPQKPSSKAKVHWFLASSEEDLHAWMEAICSVLPPPPEHKSGPHQQRSAPIQPQSSQHVSSAPPPYPGGPAPGFGFDGVAAGPPMPTPGPVPYPTQQPGYPQQPPPPQQVYYQPPGYPQQAGYPQQHPPPVAYPQQGYYQPPPAAYHAQPGAYPQQPGYYAPPPQGAYYPQQGYVQPTTVVYQQQPKKKGFLSSDTGKVAMGLAGGYAMSRMIGGGGGLGMMGWGMHGSWSSLSSFGSCGSFGSFGSFD